MDSPDSERRLAARRNRRECMMSSRLFLLANATLLAVNLAMTKTDSGQKPGNPQQPVLNPSADAGAERSGTTQIEEPDGPVFQNGIIPGQEQSGFEDETGHELHDLIEPKLIQPLYRVPRDRKDDGNKPIEL